MPGRVMAVFLTLHHCPVLYHFDHSKQATNDFTSINLRTLPPKPLTKELLPPVKPASTQFTNATQADHAASRIPIRSVDAMSYCDVVTKLISIDSLNRDNSCPIVSVRR